MECECTSPQFAGFLTVSEAAEFLGVSPSTLRNWDNSGKLKPVRHPLNGYRIYRRQELEALPPAATLLGKRNGANLTTIDWTEIGDTEHFVQFYESDGYLIESVSAYVATALAAEEGVAVIATPAHRDRIRRKLKEQGVDVTAARNGGRYVALDAAETLTKFMVDGSPDADLFTEVVGGVIRELAQGGRRVRAFGEMVALLWADGHRDAACRLEELWNDLSREYSFALFCAYPIDEFDDHTDGECLSEICASHSRILPAESFARLSKPDEQLRFVTLLQQKAQSLEAEIAKRMLVEQELSDFVENALEPLRKVGPDGRILWANRAELDLLGYSPDGYIGLHVSEFHVDQDEVNDILGSLLRGENIVDRPARLLCKNGSIKHVLCSSNGYFEKGKLVYARWFTRDVTESKEAERASALLATIVEGSDDAIVSKDLEGTITSWNASAESLFGYAESEAVGQPITLIIPLDRRGEEGEIMERLRRGERIQHFETVRVSKSGCLVDLSLTISPVRDRAGNIVGASKIARDISFRKHAEKALKEAARLKDEFLATLAHELRNPLAPIRNSLHILRMAHPTGAAAERLYETMERQVVHMVRMVDDLLELSRISRGQIEIKQEQIEVASILQNAVETSKPLIDGAGHHLELFLPAEPVMVNGDLIRLTQVFSNLLNNAAKYTNNSGVITLTAKREGEAVVVSVRDTGIGIPHNKIHLVFDMFARVENVLQRTQEGLGIGLSLVRTLVSMHGGTVEARSAGLGQGSEFVVRLPAANTQLLDPTASTNGKPGELRSRAVLPARRVLAVDDNRDSAETLGMLLKFLGADVHIAHDGKSALEAMRICRPSVVLLDIGMPDMDGFEVARRIRQDLQLQDVLLIALTGWGQEEDRRRSREAGFDHHLVKPVEIDALQALLASLDSQEETDAARVTTRIQT